MGFAYQIPAPFRASVRGRSQTPPSLFHSISVSLSLLLSCALPLLTFENKSLEFEFQSDLASERRFRRRRRVRSKRVGVAGGGGDVGAAVVEKGPAHRVPRPTPSEWPRSIQTRSNKAFPLSSLQNTKQNREREREREGEREKGGEREVKSCSASQTNFLAPSPRSLHHHLPNTPSPPPLSPPFPYLLLLIISLSPPPLLFAQYIPRLYR